MNRRLITFAVSAVLSGAMLCFTSCVDEAPEINFQVEYTHMTDFSELIRVINDQTLSISARIQAVEQAVTNGTASLEKASEALKEALVEAIGDQSKSLSEKLDAIKDAIDSNALTISDKLDLLEKAVGQGIIGLDEALEAIEKAITDALGTDGAIPTQLSAIEAQLSETKAQLSAIEAQLQLVKSALENPEISFDEIIDALTVISEAIDSQTDALSDTLSDALADAFSADGALAGCLDAILDAIEELRDSIPDNEEIAGLLEKIERAILNIGYEEAHKSVQLWEDGPYWATTNIGAEKPEDCGLYFSWGNNTGFAPTGGTFSYSFDKDNYSTTSGAAMAGKYLPSDSTLDAARFNWGGKWRMPTCKDFENLKKNCDAQWYDGVTTKYEGSSVAGCRITGRGEFSGNSIFLPVTGYASDTYLLFNESFGYYWAGESFDANSAYSLTIYDGAVLRTYDFYYQGIPIRPVIDK